MRQSLGSFGVQMVILLVFGQWDPAGISVVRSTGDPHKVWLANTFKTSFQVFMARPAIGAWVAGTECDVAAAGHTSIPSRALTAEAPTDIDTPSSILAGVRPAGISLYFTKPAGKARKTQAGGSGCKAIIIHAAAAVLAGRTAVQNGEPQKFITTSRAHIAFLP